jgi:hypothetical protein
VSGCPECWGTGYARGFGAPCSRGCLEPARAAAATDAPHLGVGEHLEIEGVLGVYSPAPKATSNKQCRWPFVPQGTFVDESKPDHLMSEAIDRFSESVRRSTETEPKPPLGPPPPFARYPSWLKASVVSTRFGRCGAVRSAVVRVRRYPFTPLDVLDRCEAIEAARGQLPQRPWLPQPPCVEVLFRDGEAWVTFEQSGP